MTVEWANSALADLVRLHEFLAVENESAAADFVDAMIAAVARLESFPRMGERLDAHPDREVRRLVAGNYEIRYQVTPSLLTVLRLWHARERR